jgi:hypothetical protein
MELLEVNMVDAIYFPNELGDVLDRAFSRCFERVYLADEGPIAFLVNVNTEGEITDQSIAIDLVGDWIEPKTDFITQKKDQIKIYGLACAGALFWKGRNQDAILIEVAEKGNDESIMLVQRYAVIQKKLKEIKMKGKIKYVGPRKSRIYPLWVGKIAKNCLIKEE